MKKNLVQNRKRKRKQKVLTSKSHSFEIKNLNYLLNCSRDEDSDDDPQKKQLKNQLAGSQLINSSLFFLFLHFILKRQLLLKSRMWDGMM